MAGKISVSQAIGADRMRAHLRDEVIAYLAASDVQPSTRRRWWREWCRATDSKIRREDLDRVASPRKPKERQLGLLTDEAS